MSREHNDKPLPPIRDRAMAYLARREHTRLELSRKLSQAGYMEDDIHLVLDDFSKRGWLSDERFAESYVQHKQARFGSLKLASELRTRGVGESTIHQLMASSKETELERAKEIWRKKFGVAPTNAKDKAKQMRFLQSRGFSAETVYRLLGTSLNQD